MQVDQKNNQSFNLSFYKAILGLILLFYLCFDEEITLNG